MPKGREYAEGSNNYALLVDDQLKVENIDDFSHDADDRLNALPFQDQNRFLPIANIGKIMKKALPNTGKTSKDAKKCMQECASEFISFITSEANDRCHSMKRKTINGEDILFAMSTLGFDNYVKPLKMYLQKYTDATKSDKNLHSNEAEYQDDDC